MSHKKEEVIYLSDRESALIDVIAAEKGMTRDEVLTKLFSEGLASRMKRKAGLSASPNVIKFRR